tara:strand:- start:37 stop:189 length:153 start_codon:yes stop_codon:yes gene_type:complete
MNQFMTQNDDYTESAEESLIKIAITSTTEQHGIRAWLLASLTAPSPPYLE